MSIEIFGFRALWSPYFFLILTGLTILFFLAATKWRTRFKDSEPLTRKQTILFLSGIVLTYIIKGSPIDLLGHILFSVHMIQMATFYLIVPILFILGIPAYMWRAFLRIPVIKQVFNLFSKPLIALILFNGVFSLYHLPSVFDTIKTDMTLHGIYTSVLFVLAIFMWWPIFNQLGEKYRISGLLKVGYMFGAGILLTPACALIIFADEPMYNTFYNSGSWLQAMALCVPAGTLDSLIAAGVNGPELFTNTPPIEDQQVGGVVMKIIQELVYAYIIGRVFYEWYNRERAKDKTDDGRSLYEPKEGVTL